VRFVIACGSERDGLTLLEVFGRSVDELESDELEAALLEAGDDVSDESALDAVGLFTRGGRSMDTSTSSVRRGRTLTMMYVRS